MSLQNKVTLITGAGSGIGRTIALTYARHQAKVVVTDIQQTTAENTAAAIREAGGEAIALTMDVTQEAAVDEAVAQAVAVYGAIDVLVSNAGIQHIEALDRLSLTDWRKILAIHLDGAFLTTRACLREMYKQNRGGRIIYIGSAHSKEASALKAPYVTAKHGLLGLCKVVAKEGAPRNVTANVICPGFVRTPLVDKQIPEQAKSLHISEEDVIQKILLKDTVNGEFTTLEDIAETALFFAAYHSNALTGQSLVVSNGWHMQ